MTSPPLPRITRADVLCHGPCWDNAESRLAALDEKYRRTEWTVLELLSLDEVSVEDRLWAVTCPGVTPNAILRRFACEVAAGALRRTGHWDERSWNALDAGMAWERGDLSAAAWYAARYAAWYAAWDAARYAAWYAARDAARYAARDAARYAAWYAARDAARYAAWYAQIGLLRQLCLRYLGGEDLLRPKRSFADECVKGGRYE